MSDILEQRVSIKDITRRLHCHRSTVTSRTEKGDLLKSNGSAGFSIGELIDSIGRLWEEATRLRHENRNLAARVSPAQRTKDEWLAKRLELNCEKLTRENREAAGELISADLVRSEVDRLARTIRQQVTDLGERIALKLGLANEPAQRVQKLVRECLTTCAAVMMRSRPGTVPPESADGDGMEQTADGTK